MKLKANTLEFLENNSPYKKLILKYESHYDLQTGGTLISDCEVVHSVISFAKVNTYIS
jgi:hypothetical protein